MTLLVLLLIGAGGFACTVILLTIAILSIAHDADADSDRRLLERRRLP